MASDQSLRVALLGLGLLVACNGSETGNPIEHNDLGESAGCEEAGSTTLALAQPSALGFSAADVLANAAGTREETLRWQTLRFGSYGPESGEQPLLVTLKAVGSTARLVDYRQKAGGGEIALDCSAQLEIEVDLQLESGGGALDETVRSTLVARRAEVATLHVRLDPAQLGGSLTVSARELGEGFTVSALDLTIEATRYALSGSLAASFEKRTADSVGQSPGAGPLAVFGLTPCAQGVAVPLDATGTGGSASTLALLREHATADLRGPTSTQDITLAFEPGPAACQLFEDDYAAFSGPGVELAGTLLVKTADGSIDGRWPVVVHANPDANGALQGAATLTLDSSVNLGNDTLAERYGIQTPDTTSYDYSALRVMLMLSQEAGWFGSIVVEGFTNADCPAATPGSGSSPGCAGAARTELANWQVLARSEGD